MQKFQEKADSLLRNNNAKIVADIKLLADGNEKKVKEKFDELQEDLGVRVQAIVQLIPDDWDKKEEEIPPKVDENK